MHCHLRFLFITVTVAWCNAITLDSVIARSDSCIMIQWTPDSLNTNPSWYHQYGSLCTGTDSIYKRCDFIPGRTYNGVAYSYGGEDPWYLFRTRLRAGFLVGSHQCHYQMYNDPSNKVTGTDCSGFLSFVWNVPRVSTSVFYSSTSYPTIPLTQVRPGDALIKASAACGYHAILVVEAYDLSEVVISEASSTSFGCRERIVDLTSSGWACYKAIRFPKLANSDIRKINTYVNNPVPEFSITVAPEKIILQTTSSFTGCISCYLPDGTLVMKTEIRIPVLSIPIPRQKIRSNLVVIKVEPSDRSSSTMMTVLK